MAGSLETSIQIDGRYKMAACGSFPVTGPKRRPQMAAYDSFASSGLAGNGLAGPPHFSAGLRLVVVSFCVCWVESQRSVEFTQGPLVLALVVISIALVVVVDVPVRMFRLQFLALP